MDTTRQKGKHDKIEITVSKNEQKGKKGKDLLAMNKRMISQIQPNSTHGA